MSFKNIVFSESPSEVEPSDWIETEKQQQQQQKLSVKSTQKVKTNKLTNHFRMIKKCNFILLNIKIRREVQKTSDSLFCVFII